MQSAGFKYGTSASSLNSDITASFSDGSISVSLTGLNPGTTYWCQAYATVCGTGDKSSSTATFYGDVKSFTTAKTDGYTVGGYLEMPAEKTDANFVNHTFGTGPERNYSYLFDKTVYTSTWVAYPLTTSHIQGSASTTSWKFDPNVDRQYQIDIVPSSYPTKYNAADYARGHQCPNASRRSDATMNSQTYYATNQTPQRQNNFNGQIWSNLEKNVRNLTSNTDTVYVVTGPVYQTVGGNETVNYLTAASSSIKPEKVPIPNYYWKAVMKVKRNSDGNITDAAAIAVWLPHKDYDNDNYSEYIVSIDQIEVYTGLDLFPLIPDELETRMESTMLTWDEFQAW